MTPLRERVRAMRRLFSPKPVERSPETQLRVDRETRRLALYQTPACPYCIRVRRTIRRLQLNIELRNLGGDGLWLNELRREGGKLQVPCLRILAEDGSVQWLYESRAISDYLTRRFS